MRQRLNMNGKFSMELQKHGVQRHWIGENLREMEAGDKRLTIFWYLWLLLGIIFNFDFWFLDLNELMKINFAICNPDLSPSVGAIRLLLPRPQLLQVSPQSPSPPDEKKRLQSVSWFSTVTTSLHFLVIVGSNLSLKIKVVQNKRTD